MAYLPFRLVVTTLLLIPAYSQSQHDIQDNTLALMHPHKDHDKGSPNYQELIGLKPTNVSPTCWTLGVSKIGSRLWQEETLEENTPQEYETSSSEVYDESNYGYESYEKMLLLNANPGAEFCGTLSHVDQKDLAFEFFKCERQIDSPNSIPSTNCNSSQCLTQLPPHEQVIFTHYFTYIKIMCNQMINDLSELKKVELMQMAFVQMSHMKQVNEDMIEERHAQEQLLRQQTDMTVHILDLYDRGIELQEYWKEKWKMTFKIRPGYRRFMIIGIICEGSRMISMKRFHRASVYVMVLAALSMGMELLCNKFCGWMNYDDEIRDKNVLLVALENELIQFMRYWDWKFRKEADEEEQNLVVSHITPSPKQHVQSLELDLMRRQLDSTLAQIQRDRHQLWNDMECRAELYPSCPVVRYEHGNGVGGVPMIVGEEEMNRSHSDRNGYYRNLRRWDIVPTMDRKFDHGRLSDNCNVTLENSPAMTTEKYLNNVSTSSASTTSTTTTSSSRRNSRNVVRKRKSMDSHNDDDGNVTLAQTLSMNHQDRDTDEEKPRRRKMSRRVKN